MKTFKTLQELWSFLLYCPLCKDVIRKIDVSGGPAETFKVLSFKKKGHLLYLNCNRGGKYIVNCLDNSIRSDIGEYIIPIFPDLPYFFLYMQSDCKKCHATFAHSANLTIDPIAKLIIDISVEYQDIYIQNNYHVAYEYKNDIMLLTNHNNGHVSDKAIHLPMIDFDFSDIDAVIKKLKTYILFS